MDSVMTWERGVSLLRREWDRLPEAVRDAITPLVREMMTCKEAIHQIMAEAGSESVCARCDDRCCARGRYHVSPTDLLAFIVTRTEIFTPDFSRSSCPYLGEGGCLMAPAYRPFPCITFACEAIEDRLSPLHRTRLSFLVDNLSSLYASIDSLLGRRVRGGIMHYAERNAETGEGILLSGRS